MTNDVYLVCGVPGSGKSWVCRQVKDKYTYVPHDDHIDGNLVIALALAARKSDKPLLTECPFGERVLKSKLEQHGLKVHPLFVVEHLTVVKDRYAARVGRPLPRSSATRASTIAQRADEWGAPKGTSAEIAHLLRDKA